MDTSTHSDKDNNKGEKNKNKKRFSGRIFMYIQNFPTYYQKIRRWINKEKQTEEEIRRSEKFNRRFLNWGVILNLVMIAIFIYSIINQGHLTREALDRADTANTNTKNSNSTYEKLTKADLRAYVVINNLFDDVRIPEDRKEFNTDYEITNFGKTPAYNVIFFDTISPCPDTINIGRAYRIIINKLAQSEYMGAVLGANNPIRREIICKRMFKNAEWFKHIEGTCNPCLIIAIKYIDIFGIKHHTIVCYIYKHIQLQFVTYSKYNWAD